MYKQQASQRSCFFYKNYCNLFVTEPDNLGQLKDKFQDIHFTTKLEKHTTKNIPLNIPQSFSLNDQKELN